MYVTEESSPSFISDRDVSIMIITSGNLSKIYSLFGVLLKSIPTFSVIEMKNMFLQKGCSKQYGSALNISIDVPTGSTATQNQYIDFTITNYLSLKSFKKMFFLSSW